MVVPDEKKIASAVFVFEVEMPLIPTALPSAVTEKAFTTAVGRCSDDRSSASLMVTSSLVPSDSTTALVTVGGMVSTVELLVTAKSVKDFISAPSASSIASVPAVVLL